MMASSVASIVASNSSSIKSFGRVVTCCSLSLLNAFLLAVENAMKISPEPLPPIPPVLVIPNGILCASLFNCPDNKGASVANTTMIEPRSANSLFYAILNALPSIINGRVSRNSFPTGTPEIVSCDRGP